MSQQGRVDVEDGERTAILDQFLTLANELYDNYGVTDRYPVGWEPTDNPQPLTDADIKVTQVWSGDKSAHINTKRNGHWTLGINFKYFRKRPMMKNASTLLAMAAHLQNNTYEFPLWQDAEQFYDFDPESVENGRQSKPFPYWLSYATLGARLDDRRPFPAFDAEQGHGPMSGGAAICDAIDGARRYAQGVTAAEDWTNAICEETDYDREWYELFSTSVFREPFEVTYEQSRTTTEIDADAISIDMPTDEALYQYAEPDLTTFESRDPKLTLQEPPAVQPTTASGPYDYVPVDTMDVAILLRRLNQTVDVHVV